MAQTKRHESRVRFCATPAFALFWMLLASSVRAGEVSFTIDDPSIDVPPTLSAEQKDRAILEHLKKSQVQAALFVCGKRVDNPEGGLLLKRWNDSGHLIANHTYSHHYFHSKKMTSEAFIEDIERGEKVIGGLTGFGRWLRFPYLKEGESAQKRDAVREYMSAHGYKHGGVTIDASDWYISGRLVERLKKDPKADTRPYRDYYLKHIWDRTEYYDRLARKVTGREVKHTLLIHHNLLNALFLGDLIRMYESKGWKTISARVAFKDPVFGLEPKIVPAGESIVWGLAKETGKYEGELRYPAEDGVYQEAEMDQLGL